VKTSIEKEETEIVAPREGGSSQHTHPQALTPSTHTTRRLHSPHTGPHPLLYHGIHGDTYMHTRTEPNLALLNRPYGIKPLTAVSRSTVEHAPNTTTSPKDGEMQWHARPDQTKLGTPEHAGHRETQKNTPLGAWRLLNNTICTSIVKPSVTGTDKVPYVPLTSQVSRPTDVHRHQNRRCPNPPTVCAVSKPAQRTSIIRQD
jgi:hypothetical protein